jgi:hypothetical protein
MPATAELAATAVMPATSNGKVASNIMASRSSETQAKQ